MNNYMDKSGQNQEVHEECNYVINFFKLEVDTNHVMVLLNYDVSMIDKLT